MELVIPVDSVVLSGITMVIFNLFLFTFVQTLCQSISSSNNLHILYDKLRPLTPRSPRIGILFGAPVGHLPLTRILTVILALYVAALIPFDISINGSSRDEYIPTVYRALVRAHPQNKPLHINYSEESKREEGETFASSRLVAIAEAHGCMNLNFSHHTLFAYAYRDEEPDKSLIPIREEITGAQCITKENFRYENIMHQWPQTEYDGATCEMSNVTITLRNRKKNTVVSAITKPKTGSACDIDFLTTKCFPTELDNCIVIAEKKTERTVHFAIAIGNSNAPDHFERHQLRKLSNMTSDDRDRFASNMAYFMALGFPQGVHNFIYMAVAEMEYNVTLYQLKRRNTSVVDLSISIPALIIIFTIVSGLITFSIFARLRYINGKNRQNYNKFSCVDDVLNMVREDELTKMRQAGSNRPAILLQENGPVFSGVDKSLL